MNIIVSTHDPISQVRRGSATRTLKVAQEFLLRKHKVTIIAPVSLKADMAPEIKIEYVREPAKKRFQTLSVIKYNILLTLKLIKNMNKCDMLFMHDAVSALFVPLLRLFYNFKFVLDVTDIHGGYLYTLEKKSIIHLFIPVIMRIEYWLIRSADLVIVGTNELKRFLVSRGVRDDKMAVVYNGSDVDELPTEKETDADKGIVYLGTVDKQHGLKILIEAMAIILAKYPEMRLYIVGAGDGLERIKELSKRVKISSKCIFTGDLSIDDARSMLKKCSIGVIPHHANVSNSLLTTLKLYDYWASNTAVVASRQNALEEVSENYGNVVFFESDNPYDLAEKIVHMIENKELVEKMQMRGYDTVKKYDWSILIPEIAEYSLNGKLHA